MVSCLSGVSELKPTAGVVTLPGSHGATYCGLIILCLDLEAADSGIFVSLTDIGGTVTALSFAVALVEAKLCPGHRRQA